MKKEILQRFSEYLEKQDLLCKLTENVKLNNFGYSEIHTVAAIEALKEPNVTAIAKHLKMTKGAVSKIIKKLVKNGLIEGYQIHENRQKIFYRLTPDGQELYDLHVMRHRLWEERDNNFFSQFSSDDTAHILKFMDAYNQYLGECIDRIEKENQK